MVFVSIEDFYEKTKNCRVLTRQEELDCALRMKEGDKSARESLIASYLPVTANHIKHLQKDMQTLSMAMYCAAALENAVDSFDFLQNSETFTHRLSWHLRNATVKYIAEH